MVYLRIIDEYNILTFKERKSPTTFRIQNTLKAPYMVRSLKKIFFFYNLNIIFNWYLLFSLLIFRRILLLH